ncbi:DUF721 domain-containing protein [Nakamurella antarctica]|uniref:DUF721 domain-containing protein n=1 Tax=Nakamurella antarctica TaxID=1902245 RepID=A0A3G8ZHS6_9ACTN|nr:DciA family protein [Nakamurella antarctica]AZI56798.1 DUF721 domain-containing protein [Nakamurella antarctica]
MTDDHFPSLNTSTPKPDGAPTIPPRGADLAREALAQARARTAAKRKAAGRTGVAGRNGAAGQRRRWSGAGPDQRDPKPLGATLKVWLKDSSVGADLDKANLLGRWPDIVGPEIAAHCDPSDLVDGELTLIAESTAWATQLRMMSPQIMGKIASAIGPNVVTKIRARGPSSPSWRFGTLHVPGRGPRDTYG